MPQAPLSRTARNALIIVVAFFFTASAGLNLMEYGVAPFDRLGAAVGASASVKPNDVNTLAQRIEEQEAELAKREAQLAGREDSLDADVGAGGTTQPVAPSDRLSLIYTTLIGALLLALILYNFYLDARFRLRPSG